MCVHTVGLRRRVGPSGNPVRPTVNLGPYYRPCEARRWRRRHLAEAAGRRRRQAPTSQALRGDKLSAPAPRRACEMGRSPQLHPADPAGRLRAPRRHCVVAVTSRAPPRRNCAAASQQNSCPAGSAWRWAPPRRLCRAAGTAPQILCGGRFCAAAPHCHCVVCTLASQCKARQATAAGDCAAPDSESSEAGARARTAGVANTCHTTARAATHPRPAPASWTHQPRKRAPPKKETSATQQRRKRCSGRRCWSTNSLKAPSPTT